MSTFDEYAALVRHLSTQQRASEQGVAADEQRRRDLGATVEYLDRRLLAQGQRLDQLGRTIGVTSPPPGPPGSVPTSGPPGPPGVPTSGPPAPSGHAGAGGSGPGTGWDGGAAAAPGRSGVGAYPQVGVGEAERALPVAVSATAAGVPGQRAGEVDAATELEMARRWADEADRYAQQTEVLAQQPALLPTWSPIARAFAVYLAFAAVSVLIMLVMVLASGVGVVGGWTLFSWMCAGLPAASLIGGWLVLGRWGRPAVGAMTAPRYPVIGFLLCFLAVPLAYCGYLILIRTLR
ncbi:hypothetical protein [Verrucosispora sp. FIM060022]|uniref:hypothetical protein n=1 Tax=Verrucosispora sp. FIM060022 TaxID=1479020 RepID=UPI000F88F7FA|nr:hypothetical protein [Verrucosispora sp. FIM060022]RUL94322.1 hypothetical protein EG812_01030 [Verrucosispora sp. FIM060022]